MGRDVDPSVEATVANYFGGGITEILSLLAMDYPPGSPSTQFLWAVNCLEFELNAMIATLQHLNTPLPHGEVPTVYLLYRSLEAAVRMFEKSRVMTSLLQEPRIRYISIRALVTRFVALEDWIWQ